MKTKVPIKQRPRGEREGEPRGESEGEGETREGGWRLGFFIKARERERGERERGRRGLSKI